MNFTQINQKTNNFVLAEWEEKIPFIFGTPLSREIMGLGKKSFNIMSTTLKKSDFINFSMFRVKIKIPRQVLAGQGWLPPPPLAFKG